MVWIKHTGCRYHTQDTGYYCSAACSMMVLAEIGVPYSQLDQDDLYNDIHAHNAASSGWYGDPYGIRYVLNNRRPAGTYGYIASLPTTEEEGSRKIVHTLHKYGVSPIALVFGCAHWIVIPGCITDVEPVSGANYAINGFWIHNSVAEDNEPHDATDPCGSGGVNGTGNEYVTYNTWQDDYFTGCNYNNPDGLKQYITVVDPEPPKIGLPRHVPREMLADGRRIIERNQAIEFSMKGIEKHLAKDERVNEILRKNNPGKPLLVKRLDRLNKYYYLVPHQNSEGVRAYSEVDARYGEFMGVSLLERNIERKAMPRVLPTRFITRRLMRQTNGRIELKAQKRALKLFPEAVSVSPTMVWTPCQESYSPAMPFYLYMVGTTPIYVRIDGKIFTELTTVFTTGLKGD